MWFLLHSRRLGALKLVGWVDGTIIWGLSFIFRFDAELQGLQEELRQERLHKERVLRERDATVSEKLTLEQTLQVKPALKRLFLVFVLFQGRIFFTSHVLLFYLRELVSNWTRFHWHHTSYSVEVTFLIVKWSTLDEFYCTFFKVSFRKTTFHFNNEGELELDWKQLAIKNVVSTTVMRPGVLIIDFTIRLRRSGQGRITSCSEFHLHRWVTLKSPKFPLISPIFARFPRFFARIPFIWMDRSNYDEMSLYL